MHVKHKNHTKPPIELLRQRVDYDAATGVFTWKKACDRSLFKDDLGWAIWHGKFAGKPVAKRNRGYVIITVTVDGKETYCQGHRVAWAFMTGEWPEHEIDHENLDRGDNRWTNLRPADHQRNQWNKGLGVRNKSGFKGVHWSKKAGKWVSQIRVDDRTRTLGAFDDVTEAAHAYQRADIQFHGAYAAVYQGAQQ